MMMFMYEYVGSIHIFSEKYTSHEFLYDSNFSQLDKSESCGGIIDNISCASICVLKKWQKGQICTKKHATYLKAVALWSIFQSYWKWFFITYNGSLLIIILNIDLKGWNIEYGKQTNKEH